MIHKEGDGPTSMCKMGQMPQIGWIVLCGYGVRQNREETYGDLKGPMGVENGHGGEWAYKARLVPSALTLPLYARAEEGAKAGAEDGHWAGAEQGQGQWT